MRIGNLELANPVILAPMSGISDKAFRLLAEEAGCGLVYTEMISVNALAYDSQRTRSMFDLTGERGPTAVQIFGSEPRRMAGAAIAAESAGAGVVDINMGCPAPKVVKNLEGCALMRDIPLAERIIKAVVRAVGIPVTVKMRKGWDENSVNAPELARVAESCGAKSVTVHGRTRGQFYSGKADWDIITQVKKAVNIAVVGNGDIFAPEDAVSMMTLTGCDAVMIGRGSLGNPWLLKRSIHLIADRENIPGPDFRDRIDMALRHLEMVCRYKDEPRAVKEMRKHIAWYLKGLQDSSKMRDYVNKAVTAAALREILIEYREDLEKGVQDRGYREEIK